MSQTRQAEGPQVRTSSVTYASGYRWRARASDWAHLIFSSRGMMTVHTPEGVWVVPPHQAMWMPPALRHDVEMAGRVAMRTLYLAPGFETALPRVCRVIDVSPLLRELLRRAMKVGELDRRFSQQRHLMDLLLDEIAVLPLGPVDLPSPRDARALRAAAAIRAAPELPNTLAGVSRDAGASARTLERLFRAETGLAFGAWRQRARLVRALQLLADGTTVTNAAIAVGYDSTSAFVAAFRKTFGTTPGRYFAAG